MIDSVCRKCNTEVLSRQEAYFKQDTLEGRFAARYLLGRSKNYRPTYKRHKVQTTYESEPLVDPDFQYIIGPDGRQCLPKQILLRGSKGQIYNILDTFDGKKVAKKIDDLKDPNVELRTCGFSDDELKQLYDELAKCGKSGTEEQRKQIPAGTVLPRRIEEYNSMIDRDLKRVILKTAFNYFAYCGLSGFASLVYGNNFAAVRSYVLMPDAEYKGGELVTAVPNQRIILNGQELSPLSPNHLIRFYSEFQTFDGSSGVAPGIRRVLSAEVNLFSCCHYKINLSFDDVGGLDLPGCEFGSGHVFQVDKGSWCRVDKNGTVVMPNDFSLFRNLS